MVAAFQEQRRRGEPVAAGVAEAGEEWRSDIDVLLAERARRGARETIEVELPERLSVSQLVLLRRDPVLLARALRRPLPAAPNPQARRGNVFHTWLETRYGVPRLLDVDELPGAADEHIVGDAEEELRELQDAFERSEWAARQPTEVEAPFELVIDGVVIRGRADAVFPLEVPDGGSGLEVIDWKTGPPPRDPRAQAARSVQLAAYRLAWAQLSGLELGQVRAGFHHVRENQTVRPVDLLDRAGLVQLVRSVPAGEQERP